MKTVWLIGAGNMALQYSKILKDLDVNLIVIGRGEKSAKIFFDETGIYPKIGGLKTFLKSNPSIPDKAIVAVSVEQLYECVNLLIKYGIKDILSEKPGGVNVEQITDLANIAKKRNVKILLGYNRRFYASVKKAKKIIENDGGLRSFNFEFTEWGHVIEKLEKDPLVKSNWFLANSSHVIDLAFYIGGFPAKISSFSGGQGDLDWHNRASIFSGAGITHKGIFFSYKADWNAPGRWQLEFLTSKHKLYFSPIEKLRIQNAGELEINEVTNIDYSLDEKYKPGLFLQVVEYLEDREENFINIVEMSKMMDIYENILNGSF